MTPATDIITRLIGYAGHDVECKLNLRMGAADCTCGYSAAIADALDFLEGESDDE